MGDFLSPAEIRQAVDHGIGIYRVDGLAVGLLVTHAIFKPCCVQAFNPSRTPGYTLE